MPESRRTRTQGPRREGRSGPGAASGRPRRRTGAGTGGPNAQKASRGPQAVAAHRPRLTGRAAILVLVVAVLAVSYASSLRAYLQQRGQINDLNQQISERQASIDTLQDEKSRFDDPAYVEARARLSGFVMPGETVYQVRQNGAPLQAGSSLGDPATVATTAKPAWWDTAWASDQVAGHPPPVRSDPIPPALINGTGTGTGKGNGNGKDGG